MTESAKKSKVNALSLKKAMAKDMAIVGDKLADTVLSGSTARAEQEAGRVAVVDMVASLEKGLAPGFTKEGLLYKDFPASDLGAVVTDAFCNMVDIVRKAGHDRHASLRKAGKVPPYSKNDMGKNANKTIREKRRAIQNLLVSLTSKSKKIRNNARSACSKWVKGQTNMSWGMRTEHWMKGVEELIGQSALTVCVGRGGEGISGLFYRGEQDSDQAPGSVGIATFGTGKNEYSITLTHDDMPVSELYEKLGQQSIDARRLLTQSDAGRLQLRDSFTPDDLCIIYTKASD